MVACTSFPHTHAFEEGAYSKLGRRHQKRVGKQNVRQIPYSVWCTEVWAISDSRFCSGTCLPPRTRSNLPPCVLWALQTSFMSLRKTLMKHHFPHVSRKKFITLNPTYDLDFNKYSLFCAYFFYHVSNAILTVCRSDSENFLTAPCVSISTVKRSFLAQRELTHLLYCTPGPLW